MANVTASQKSITNSTPSHPIKSRSCRRFLIAQWIISTRGIRERRIFESYIKAARNGGDWLNYTLVLPPRRIAGDAGGVFDFIIKAPERYLADEESIQHSITVQALKNLGACS